MLIVVLMLGCVPILPPYGARMVAYKKYVDYDEDALKTWEEAPAGCQVSMRARVCVCVGVYTRALSCSVYVSGSRKRTFIFPLHTLTHTTKTKSKGEAKGTRRNYCAGTGKQKEGERSGTGKQNSF